MGCVLCNEMYCMHTLLGTFNFALIQKYKELGNNKTISHAACDKKGIKYKCEFM